MAVTPSETGPEGVNMISLNDDTAPSPTLAPLPDEAYWHARVDAGLARWRENASAIPSSPDAAALVVMIEGAGEFVIRQLPSAAKDAIALCDDTSISRTQLAARLGQDPSLVQALLRAANSAALGAGRQPVLGVDGALERIGIVGGRSIVLANCVDGLLSRPGSPFDQIVSEVWAHMIRCGPLARALAPAFGIDREAAFSVGLLHDVGKLVVFDQLSALRARQRRPVIIPSAWFSAMLQDLHEPLGALAALKWSMGPEAAAAIGDHHRNGPVETATALAEVIYTAERADHAKRLGESLDVELVWQAGRLSTSANRVSMALDGLSSAA